MALCRLDGHAGLSECEQLDADLPAGLRAGTRVRRPPNRWSEDNSAAASADRHRPPTQGVEVRLHTRLQARQPQPVTRDLTVHQSISLLCVRLFPLHILCVHVLKLCTIGIEPNEFADSFIYHHFYTTQRIRRLLFKFNIAYLKSIFI